MGHIYKFYKHPKPIQEMSEDEFEAWYFEYNKRKLMLLNRLSESQNHRCAYCSVETWLTENDQNSKEDWQQASLDHVKPKTFGGNDKLSNLVVACRECNSTRGDQNAYQFFKKVTDPNFDHFIPPLKKSVRQKELNLMILYLISMRFFPEDVERMITRLGLDYGLSPKKKIPGQAYRQKLEKIRERVHPISA